ncbi:hypothetical protein DSLASN_03830 [Desulfoluna limicola]|uniref:Uncharacterized protein n=1 Tax=Desulfoluna limicola TaxID=2810562 RepID=A0ABN6EYR0_9BACT|nr:AAA family ATPase [Desulfoluna limicola]BCS94751.1 hypothetical protein DSLASN_03830 [Desulfoluna limicola]
MKITEISIKKFRSIDKAEININNINAIVGENNSGKSSLLRALNAFFNFEDEKSNFYYEIHRYIPRSIPKIAITFSDLPDDPELQQYINNEQLNVEITFNPRNQKRTFKYKSNGGYQNCEKNIINIIKRHISYIFIPPNRDGKQLIDTENNILRLLLEAYLDGATQNRDNYSAKFQLAAKFLESNALSKIAIQAKKEYALNNQFDFEIKLKESLTYKDYLSNMSISIEEHGLVHSLIECGSGVQSLTIIALYSLLGKLKNENIVIGLEEPETNLHPQAQREIIFAFNKLVKEQKILQFFFTTHSSELIDQVDHSQVTLYRKHADTKRGFKSSVSKVPHDFFEKYNLNEFKYYQFHRYRNSEFFFSKFIVIVESKNEIEVIKTLLKKSDISLELSGISFFNLSGIDNIRYPIFLLEELKIPYLLIVDKDFFVPYIGDKLEDSRSDDGFPKYRYEYKNVDIISKLITSSIKRDELLNLLRTNYTRASELLEQYNIISMRYCLEMDLVATSKGKEQYYDILNIPETNRCTKTILVDNHKSSKKIRNILKITQETELRNLPFSYRRIRSYLIQKCKELQNA